MPRSCDVLGCPNGSGNSAVSYHVVPRDEPRRSEWLAAVPMRNREGRAPPKLMVCSRHFSPCDYVYDPSLRVSLGCHQRPALSRTAVPAIAPVTRQELALLQQEIVSVDTANSAGSSTFGDDGCIVRMEGDANVLPLVVNVVEGQPSSSWLQMDELIRAGSWVPPNEAMPADSSECTRSSLHENFTRNVRNTVAVSPRHMELSLPVLSLDVNLAKGQPSSLWLKDKGVTKAYNWCSPNGKTSAFDADSRRKTQEHPQLNASKTSKMCHRGIGHNKMVQVCIRGKSIGAQVNTTMKEVMSEGLQTDIPDMLVLTSASTQT
ncbi:uncharacterized protein [Dermacentor andersoni]|uniref:uncharacterized protein isoform X1 n=1 Tax=Dermacentor andersoni TaxID=34620 RepID=UPI0021558F20|nr:uncharacterized protein LOC126527097 isoform X1 [Dermacentor andersoni]XP_054924533.1 uncharacterized protein LOC126527097 isoform X1 [Dermacentor andersoni]